MWRWSCLPFMAYKLSWDICSCWEQWLIPLNCYWVPWLEYHLVTTFSTKNVKSWEGTKALMTQLWTVAHLAVNSSKTMPMMAIRCHLHIRKLDQRASEKEEIMKAHCCTSGLMLGAVWRMLVLAMGEIPDNIVLRHQLQRFVSNYHHLERFNLEVLKCSTKLCRLKIHNTFYYVGSTRK